MSYPHLTPETATECSRAAYAYSPDCYCVFHWGFADFLPRAQYYDRPTKWLEATVWRCIGPDQPDRYVVAVASDNGRELLRNLRAALSAITTGGQPDPSLLGSDQAQGNCLPQGRGAHPEGACCNTSVMQATRKPLLPLSLQPAEKALI